MTSTEATASVGDTVEAVVTDQTMRRPLWMNDSVCPWKSHRTGLRDSLHQAITGNGDLLAGDVDGEIGTTSWAGESIAILHFHLKTDATLEGDSNTSGGRRVHEVVHRPRVEERTQSHVIEHHDGLHGGAGARLYPGECVNKDRWVGIVFLLADHLDDEESLALLMPQDESLIAAKTEARDAGGLDHVLVVERLRVLVAMVDSVSLCYP
jgi:hypothetical protein